MKHCHCLYLVLYILQVVMLTMQTLHEPMVADEVLTPASLPPSATNLTTRGRSLFNDVLSAIRMRQHRACSNNSGIIVSLI